MNKDKPGTSLDQTRPAIFSGKSEEGSGTQTNEYNSIKQSHPYPFLKPVSREGSIGQMGHYEIKKLLGEGGMGFVFKAEDEQLHRTVALKVMKPILTSQPNARERFLHEARAMASIQSDNVVVIHQVGEQHDVPYLAMEFLKGQSMEQWIKAVEITPIDMILKWGIEISEGLATAHEQNLIHRDIKPANLWIEAPDNRVKILDFGLAYAMESDVRHTQTGHLIGTLEYMAPEQFESSMIHARSDLFSLGCVLYQLTSNTSPFAGSSQLSVIKKLATSTPLPLQKIRPGIPYALSQLINQLLSKDPDKRPASAKEVSLRLQDIRKHVDAEQIENTNYRHVTQSAEQLLSQLKGAARTEAVINSGKDTPGNGRLLFRLAVIALIVGGVIFYQSNNSKLDPAAEHSSPDIMQPVGPSPGIADQQGPVASHGYEPDKNTDVIETTLTADGFEPEPVEVLDSDRIPDPDYVTGNESSDNSPESDIGFNTENMQRMPPPYRFEEGVYPPPPPPGGPPPRFRASPPRPR